MLLSTANQLYVFLSMVYVGIIIGILYDVYRTVRYCIKPGRLVTGFMDLFFWMLVAAMSFFALFYINDGEVRIYTFLGLGAGWTLYLFAISWLVMNILRGICRILSWAVQKIVKILTWPMGIAMEGVQMPFKLTRKAAKKLVSKFRVSKKKKKQ